MRAPNSNAFAHGSLLSLCRILPKCSNAKIHRLLLRKVVEDCISTKQHFIKFILKAPEEGVICPITQEPITAPMSDEALPFDLDHPDRTAIRLACQHDFSAFWLLFNWAHNNHVKCPLCRAGPSDFCLDVARMPHHIRVPLQRHMRKLQLNGGKTQMETNSLSESVTARCFIDAVAGDSYLDLFPEQQEQEYIDRLECTHKFSLSLGETCVFLSPSKSQYIFNLFASWVKCDPVKNTPSWNIFDFSRAGPNIILLGTVLHQLDHVLNVMYGLSFSVKMNRHNRQFVYTVFQSSARDKINDPF